MKLRIRNVERNDFMQYKCVAKNALGYSDGSITLYGKIETPLRLLKMVKIIFKITSLITTEVHPPTTTTTTTTTTTIILPDSTRKPRRRGEKRRRNKKRQREHQRAIEEEKEIEELEEEEKVIEEVNHISFIINEEKGKINGFELQSG